MQQIASLFDLSGKFGSINAGDKHGEPVDSFVDQQVNMQKIHGIAQNFHMLRLKRTDYFITGYWVGVGYLRAKNLEKDYSIALTLNNAIIHNAFTHKFAANCPHVVTGFEQSLTKLQKTSLINKTIFKYSSLIGSK